MHDEDDLALTDLAQRRWVRYDMPVMVCVDTEASGDQQVRHVVPILDEIELATDDQHEPVVYGPDGTERVPDRRADDAAWQAISHAGATKDDWIGEKPYDDWDWLEHPEDLTAEDRDAKEEVGESKEGETA
jgi:hypothetical protein